MLDRFFVNQVFPFSREPLASAVALAYGSRLNGMKVRECSQHRVGDLDGAGIAAEVRSTR